jgi:hypothetical protein
MKSITIWLSALTFCVGLQNTANAEGIPVDGPSTLQADIVQLQSMQAQLDALQTARSQSEATNKLLGQVLAVQQQTLSELASIDRHLAVSEITQRAAADTAREQFNLQVSNQSRDHAAR